MNEHLTIRERALNPILSYLGLCLFAVLYIFYIRYLPKQGYIIFSLIGLFFNLYLYIFSHWSQIVIINKYDKIIITKCRIGPFNRETKIYLADYSYVTISQPNSGGAYVIGLIRNQRTEPSIRLISIFSNIFAIFKAWKYAVMIAKYLELPLYDMLRKKDIIWEKDELPLNINERMQRIAQP